MGSLARTPAPRLLLDLHREGFSGRVELERGPVRMRLELRAGQPVRVDSTRPRDRLCAVLEARGSLGAGEREKLEARLAGAPDELAALARTRAVPPRELVAALRDQVRGALLEALGWQEGEFRLDPDEARGDAPALPLDPVPLVCEAVARHWRPDRVLTALGARATEHPTPGDDYERLRSRLGGEPAADALLDALDGRRSAFELLREHPAPEAGAALFVLHVLGGLAWDATPAASPDAPAEDAPADPAAPAIEIVVTGRASRDPSPESAADERGRERSEAADDRGAALREEVLDLHGRLAQLDAYALLGVERDAPPARVKRAYLALAKRLHPDALARLGLDDVKAQANALFAEISRAHTTLSDPEARRSYDAALEGHSVGDADRLGQAESLFRKGEILMKAGSFGPAAELLEAAAGLWPEEADYQSALGWALFKKTPSELERARAHLERAVALDERAAPHFLRLHYVLKAAGEGGPAAAALERARRIDPAARV